MEPDTFQQQCKVASANNFTNWREGISPFLKEWIAKECPNVELNASRS
jgi:hypothetical protein